MIILTPQIPNINDNKGFILLFSLAGSMTPHSDMETHLKVEKTKKLIKLIYF